MILQVVILLWQTRLQRQVSLTLHGTSYWLITWVFTNVQVAVATEHVHDIHGLNIQCGFVGLNPADSRPGQWTNRPTDRPTDRNQPTNQPTDHPTDWLASEHLTKEKWHENNLWKNAWVHQGAPHISGSFSAWGLLCTSIHCRHINQSPCLSSPLLWNDITGNTPQCLSPSKAHYCMLRSDCQNMEKNVKYSTLPSLGACLSNHPICE